MRVRVLLQITGDDGSVSPAEEVAAFEKVTERPEDLGLSIAEGKAMLAAAQRQVVDVQVGSWADRHRGCEACGKRRRSARAPTCGSSRVVLRGPRFAGHLLRAGFATAAARAGHSEATIMRHGRRRSARGA